MGNTLTTAIQIDTKVNGVESVDTLHKKLHTLESGLDDTTSALHSVDDEMDDVAGASHRAETQINALHKAFGGLKGLIGALGIGIGAKELIELADGYNTLSARVRLATGDGAAFVSAMDGVQKIAQDTNANLADTAEMFSKLSDVGKQMGLSQERVLGVTKTINQAVKLSGASADASAAAIQQLNQGLQSGVLRGDEFNSVMEQAPTISRAIADSLGVTTSQLRTMAGEGKITADVIIDAFEKQKDVINKQFATLPVTFGDAMTAMKNSLMQFVGGIDGELGASGGLAQIIKDIADGVANIDPAIIHSLTTAFSTLGQMANIVAGTVGEVYGAFDSLSNAKDGVGVLQKTLDSVVITLGTFHDILASAKIVFEVAFGAMIKGAGDLLYAFSLITGKFKDTASAMQESGQKMMEDGFRSAHGFESAWLKAANNAQKTHAERMGDIAVQNKIAFEKMASDSNVSAGKIEEAFIKYAKSAIEANNGVVSESLKAELAQQKLSASVDDAGKVVIKSMTDSATATQKLGADLADLDKHKDAFAALGLDATEFATGVSEKATKALSAFSQIATISAGDTQKLGMAYNAAKDAIGDNQLALQDLQARLSQATSGNMSLQSAVLNAAEAHKQAKKGANAHSEALAKLGVDIDAANGKLSQSRGEMVKHLRTGLEVIKQKTTSAQALSAALNKALDTALGAAKTTQDFKEIKKALDEVGLSAKLNADNMAKLKAGVDTHASAHAKASAATQSHQKALDDNSNAQQKNQQATERATQSTTQSARAHDETTRAANNATTATHQHADAQSALVNSAGGFLNTVTQKVNALAQLTGTLDETKQAYDSLWVGRSFIGNDGFFKAIADINTVLDNHKQALTESSDQIAEYSKKLGGAGATTTDVANATAALHHAQNLSLNGFLKLDNAKLDNLKAQIDSAQQRLDGLAKSAEQTVNNLEQQLARIKGNDDEARRLEHAQKIADIEEKIAQARARGNAKEIDALVRAKELQTQINSEEDKKARQSTHLTSTTTSHASDTKNTGGVDVSGVAHAWDKRILEAEKRGAQNVLNQLHAEAKRLAR